MRFLLDQNAEVRIAGFLVHHGHDVTRIARDYPPGLPDEEVLAIAQQERRVLITNDSDFEDLIFRRALPHSGVILLRFPPAAPTQQKIAAIERLLVMHEAQLHRFLIVSPQDVRAR